MSPDELAVQDAETMAIFLAFYNAEVERDNKARKQQQR